MRKLAWAAAGFAGAAFLAEYFLPAGGLPYIAAALAVLAAFSPLLGPGRRWRAAALLLSAALGLLSWWGHYERHVAPCEAAAGQELTVTARVTEYPEETEKYDRVAVKILSGGPEEKAVLYLYGGHLPALTPGDIISVRVRTASSFTLSGRRAHTYTARNQNLLGYIQDTPVITGRAGWAWLYFPQRLCRAVKNLCGSLFPADTAAFMTALLTGDTAALRAEGTLYGSMRVAGVLHIVAVSGMHIMVLTAFVRLLLGRGKRTSLLCLPVMAVFVVMTGCSPSAARAAVTQALMLLAPLLGRESDDVTSLSAALLLLLAVNPMAVGGVSLQLSFSCAAGFVVLLPRLAAWAEKRLPMENALVRLTAGSLECSLCAAVFSAPVAAYYFGTIPLLSPAANLLTLPVVEACFCGGYIACALGALFPALGGAAAWVMGWLVRWCALVYDGIAALPFACLYTEGGGGALWLAGVYVLFGLWAAARKRGVKLSAVIPAELGIIGLCAVFLTQGFSLRDGAAALAALDVGQGQCVVLLDGSSAVVVDCGGSGRENAGETAAEYLLSAGKTRVDLLVLTHLHDDHTNGVETLLSRLPVDCLILPAGADDEGRRLEEITAAAQERGVRVISLSQPCVAQVGQLELTLLLPQAGTEANERGIVVLAAASGSQAMIMGDGGTDAELALLEDGLVPDVDVLVAGHHGSKTASGALFLRAARAETAIVSVGANSYGLPAAEIMERLAEYCPSVLRTDEAGTVTISMKADDWIYG